MSADSEKSLPELVGKDSNLAGAVLERIQRGRGWESLEASRAKTNKQYRRQRSDSTKMAILSVIPILISPVPPHQWCLSVSWGHK